MLIDQLISSLSAEHGGPTRTVMQLSAALAKRPGIGVRLLTQSNFDAKQKRTGAVNIEISSESESNRLALMLGLTGKKTLESAISRNRPDLIHSNGVWHPLNHWSARASRSYRIPLVIQPHGMLEPWALNWRPLRKRLALALYQRRDLQSAAVIVATADREAENLRRFGLRQPIAVIPNGVDLTSALTDEIASSSAPMGIRRALFLGRIHPVKGLTNLLRAWSLVDSAGWLLQLAGPDEGRHLAEIQSLAGDLGLADRVRYIGEFKDDAKWSAYANADLFVLPSFTENFGIVVAEALSVGLPVVTTTGTPWQDLETHNCGWWVPPTIDGLKTALADALSASPGRLKEMGERGRVYVQRYNWPDIAAQMVEVYRWVLKQGPMPACVRVD